MKKGVIIFSSLKKSTQQKKIEGEHKKYTL